MGGCQKGLFPWHVPRSAGVCSDAPSLKTPEWAWASLQRSMFFAPMTESPPESPPKGNSSPWVASPSVTPLHVTVAFGCRC